MYYAKVDDYFIRGNAIFYHVVGKLDLAPILQHRLNQSETLEEAVAHWNSEQHWLADWNNQSPFQGFCLNCEVAFDIKSSTYYPTMKHDQNLSCVRNINITSIERYK